MQRDEGQTENTIGAPRGGEKGLSSERTVSSRLPGFYELPRAERLRIAQAFSNLEKEQISDLASCGALPGELVDTFIENAIGTFSLPLGVATNFLVDGHEVLVPMAVEESSVLAAASHGAKLVRAGGGFVTEVSRPVMTGQIQIYLTNQSGGPLVSEKVAASARIRKNGRSARKQPDFEGILTEKKEFILETANRGHDRLIARGGGAVDLTWRHIPEIDSVIVHLHVDTRDAMGANIVNTMSERISGLLVELLNAADFGLRILTNLTDRRLAKSKCRVPHGVLASRDFSGSEVAKRIVEAYRFAYYDPYRATTNNKGIMNGIDPVLIATGNDWRAVEAGAHAYACRLGTYRPMAEWSLDPETGDLLGELELPMAVGTVGGVTRLHPTARAALELLRRPSASALAGIVCSVGLAQNLAALKALSSEGIQRGHMGLHQKNLEILYRQGAVSK